MQMPSALKPVLIITAALVGLIALAAIAFALFFPKDFAIREAERQIEQATARQLDIAGEVNITLWPALGFSAEQVSLSNPEGFADEHFLSADRIVFAIALMPLLSGDIEIKRLVLEGADLRLTEGEDGAVNWDFPTEESESQPATLEDLRLGDVRLVDSRIAFTAAGAEPILIEHAAATPPASARTTAGAAKNCPALPTWAAPETTTNSRRTPSSGNGNESPPTSPEPEESPAPDESPEPLR
jgi:uncharacterized protein involved in outer membrane biogenesis